MYSLLVPVHDLPKVIPVSAITIHPVPPLFLNRTVGGVLLSAVSSVLYEHETRLGDASSGSPSHFGPVFPYIWKPIVGPVSWPKYLNGLLQLLLQSKEALHGWSADGEVAVSVDDDVPRDGRLNRPPPNGVVPELDFVDFSATETKQFK